jgi:predicted TIM-barrel fold metal-dependent hydrolase
MIIDVHTHHFPFANLQEAGVWAQAESYWYRQMALRRQRWVSLQAMLAHMDQAGVQVAVLQGWYFEQHSSCQALNQHYAACLRQHPERLRAFVALQPAAGVQAVLETLNWARDHGFCGIGELFPAVQGFEVQGPAMRAVLGWAAQQRWPVMLHVTDPFGKSYPGMRITPLADYLWLVHEHPQVNFILAHWGGLLPWYRSLDPTGPWQAASLGLGKAELQTQERFLEAISLGKHVYYDTAATPLLYDASIWQRFMQCVRPTQVLLGTDYPLNVAQAPDAPASFQPTLLQLRSSGLGQPSQQAIAGANAARLLWGSQAV